jgi:hypothetical protein
VAGRRNLGGLRFCNCDPSMERGPQRQVSIRMRRTSVKCSVGDQNRIRSAHVQAAGRQPESCVDGEKVY